MKYRFIEEQRETHSVEEMVGLLNVSGSGYYTWRRRCVSSRAGQAKALVEQIEAIQSRVKFRYGSPA